MNSAAEAQFELAKLYCDRADFEKALPNFKTASEKFLSDRNFQLYLECESFLLRIHAELEQFDEIQATKEKLQDLVLKEGLELSSKTYYVLGVCAGYKRQTEVALEYFQKALAIALAIDSKADICYAINGIAISYHDLGRTQEALKELYNLQVFFQVLDLPDVQVAANILNAKILMELGKSEQAIELLWQAYEFNKRQKNLYLHISLLYNIGRTYLRAGDKELARVYLNLASKVVDPKNLVRLSKRIQESLNELGAENKEKFDLVFQLENHTVVERKLGTVDFKNQFILLDLLKLFVQNQGQVYSKEYLVETVWKQKYDPAVHDNKIYVTIKRLRKMIEPDYEKPRYIFRAKNGYFMNKSAKIWIEGPKGGEL